ncbi:MAG: hypothetical protein MSC30_09350 [Gaiellaceae bacterium MAG52_C11]|nr:hypothetical protein [Candidatus Gaiellasilicea maunaloa]
MKVGLLLVAVLVVAGCGSESASDEAAAPPPPVTVTVTETDTGTETAPPPEQGETCSTSTIRATLPEQDVPEPVAELRRAIWGAAIACDYEELERLALERGEGFTFSYGGAGSAADFWRSVEEAGTEDPLPMLALATILAMPFTRNESGSYAWPAAYEESPTDEAWQDLADSGLYSQAEVDAMRSGAGAGGYLGYRTAITADGDWQFFVAGD